VLLADERLSQHTISYSAFAQLSYKFAPDWELSGGARWTHETKTPTDISHPSVVTGYTTANVPFTPPQATFTNTSPEVTLSYKPTQDSMLYATYREAFIAGGYNLVTFGVTPGLKNDFNPETAKGGEIGAKGTFFRQLQIDTALYYYDYTDLQLSASNPLTLTSLVTNAGGAASYGAETAFRYAPEAVHGLLLRGSIDWNHARYTTFSSAPCYGGQTVGMGCDRNVVNGVANAQSLAGYPLTRAMDWAGALGGTYDLSIGTELTLSMSVDALYSGRYNPTLEQNPYAEQAAATRLNTSIALRGRNDRWELALIGQNLTNVLRINDANSLGFTGAGTGTKGPSALSDLVGSPTDPRTLLLQLTVRFGK
jgi:outer membrane receptor protein involved in Fe transport